MRIKKFDCVEMKRRAAARLHRKLKAMSFREECEYWARLSDELAERQQEIRAQQQAGIPPSRGRSK